MSTSASGKPRAVPFAVTHPERIPTQRYYSQEFYDLECEHLWPRVWQMACRLEEIPKRGDYVVYEILGHSVIVTRVDDQTVKAYHNHCRHRGVKLVSDRGRRPKGFTCPFHGWQWGLNGDCTYVLSPELFSDENLDKLDLRLKECRLEMWGGCAFINLDDNAPPLRQSIEPFATAMDAWRVETLKVEWWYAAHLPCNWKLAMEAFMEGYHVMQTHPQLLSSSFKGPEDTMYGPIQGVPMSRWATMSKTPPTSFDTKAFVNEAIEKMKVLNVGMAGMTHEKDVRVAEAIREIELPPDPREAVPGWFRELNDAVVEAHKKAGMDVADLNDVAAKGYANSVNFCYPHYFLLPTYGSAASYRIRPLGPEECLFELWSLTRFPDGEERPALKTPEPWPHNDPRWPPIPTQDFTNLPLQQTGLHTKGFEFMRLSAEVEGLISRNHQTIDGYLAGLSDDKLLAAAQQTSGPIDVPCKDLGLGVKLQAG